MIGRIIGEKPAPGETFGGRGHGVILAWKGLTPNCQDQEGSMDFLGQLPQVLYVGDGSELCPPVWGV